MKSLLYKVIIISLFLGIFPNFVFAQSISQPWRTIETKHFRVHFAAPYLDWTEALASRLESIHEKVTAMVGFTPSPLINVVVIDPLSVPNGMALPLLKRPRIIVFTTAPTSSSSLGLYEKWEQLLVTHELTHIVHLTRPPHNTFERIITHIFPLGPIARKSPTWIVEGYAVLMEGKLTGYGRPNSSFRAMFIRELAAAGKMPTYDQLNGCKRWASGAYPYLFGSAFTQWLQKREGSNSLTDLWKRMTARKKRSFDEAFKGVFRAPPDELYGKFVAETTSRAVSLKKELEKQGLNEGEIWQKKYRSIGVPSLSPDGKLMAIVTTSKSEPPKLEIWSITETKEDEKEKKKEKVDPYDIPDKPSAPPVRKVKYTLPTINGHRPFSPKFMPDGKTVLFHFSIADNNGELHPDIFLWNFEKSRVKRVTHKANVRSACPYLNGTKAIALHSQYGKTTLVNVDLKTGKITSLFKTPPRVDVVYAQPSVSSDNRFLAYLIHQNAHWSLKILELKTLKELWSVGNGNELLAYPTWSNDSNNLFFISDRTGIPNIEQFNIKKGQRERISNVFSGAMAPVPDPSGKFIYYIRFWAKGMSIYRLNLQNKPELDEKIASEKFYPAIPPQLPPQKQAYSINQVPKPHNYGWGKQEFSTSGAFGTTASSSSIQYGIRLGDIIGRNETILLGGFSFRNGPAGATLREMIHRFPIDIFLQSYWLKQSLSDGKDSSEPFDYVLDNTNFGFTTELSWKLGGKDSPLNIGAAGFLSRVTFERDDRTIDRNISDINLTLHLFESKNTFAQFQKLKGSFQSGITDGNQWSLAKGGLTVGFSFFQKISFIASYSTGKLEGDFTELDSFRLGGWNTTLFPTIGSRNLIEQPALWEGVRYGSEFYRFRASFSISALGPFQIYHETLNAWNASIDKPDPIRIIGMEVSIVIPQLGLINFPETSIKAGVAKVLDEPMKDDVKAYLTLNINP